MSWVALIFTPVVLAYQGWTYWIFRKRVGGPRQTAGPAQPEPTQPSPAAAVDEVAP